MRLRFFFSYLGNRTSHRTHRMNLVIRWRKWGGEHDDDIETVTFYRLAAYNENLMWKCGVRGVLHSRPNGVNKIAGPSFDEGCKGCKECRRQVNMEQHVNQTESVQQQPFSDQETTQQEDDVFMTVDDILKFYGERT